MKVNSLSDLRDIAAQNLNDLLDGKSNLTEIDDFCKLAGLILKTLQVEIAYLKTVTKEKPQISFISSNLKLIEQKE